MANTSDTRLGPNDAPTVAGDAVEMVSPGFEQPAIAGYEILGLIGRGGMGRVYKARHLRLQRIVALKTLALEPDAEHLARFEEETQAVARLRHPNIAQIFDSGMANGRPYFAMEYVEGGSLAERLAGKPQLPREAAALLEPIARGIQHAHETGIIHRDIKPGNILLHQKDGPPNSADTIVAGQASTPIPKVTDFGLARRLEADSRITRTGEIIGTPSYMAPEQASGVVTGIGPAADIYALGAVLYEMLVGRPPFHGPDPMQTVMQVLSMDPVAPRRLQPGIPRDLETICLKCLQKSPRQRYRRAGDLADDLGRFMSGKPIVARPVNWWERAWKWARRKPWAAAALALAGMFVLGLVAAVVLLQSANRRVRLANVRLDAAKKESDENLNIARTAIDRLMVRLSSELASIPGAEHVRRESLEDARVLYERLAASRAEDATGRELALKALQELAQTHFLLGSLEKAEAAARQALDRADALIGGQPGHLPYRQIRISVLSLLVRISTIAGKTKEGEEYYRQATGDSELMLQVDMNDAASLNAIAGLNHNRAVLDRVLQRFDDAESRYRVALNHREQIQKLNPSDQANMVSMSETRNNLAGIFLIRNKPAAAVTELAQAEKLLEGSSSPAQRWAALNIRGNLGVAYEMLKKPAEAVSTFRQAVPVADKLAAEFPTVPRYRLAAARMRMNLANNLDPKQNLDEMEALVREAGIALDRLARESPNDAAVKALRSAQQAAVKEIEGHRRANPPPAKEGQS